MGHCPEKKAEKSINMSKADDAADFLLNFLEGDKKVVDFNEDDMNSMNQFSDVMDINSKILFDEETEKEYMAFNEKNKKNGFPQVSRAEFLAMKETMPESKKSWQ